MRRREFIGLLGVAAASFPLASLAQQSNKAVRIGFLMTASLDQPDGLVMIDAFRQALRARGYVEGQTVVIETRSAVGEVERFPRLAAELVALKVDVIVASNSLSARAAQKATNSIPIVVAAMGDAVGDGLVASLSRPGGNVTGLTFLGPELLPKRLTLLKEALPKASRIAALWHPRAYGERTMNAMMTETEAAARTLGVHLQLVAVHGPDEMGRAFSTIADARADALMVFPSPMLFTYRNRIVDLAAKYRLPSMAMGKEFAQLGGLMAYGASIVDLHRRAAAYVDQILRGAKPSDIPVEQPTKFELVINLKTAKALGLTMPQTLLVRADEVIE